MVALVDINEHIQRCRSTISIVAEQLVTEANVVLEDV